MFQLLFLWVLPHETKAEEVVLAVRSHLGNEAARQRWGPTIDYLNDHFDDTHFTLKPDGGIGDMEQLVASGAVDFILTQPSAYVDLERLSHATRILTLVREKGLTQFGSVIFSHKKSNIVTVEGIVGRSIAGVGKKAFGGWLVGYDALFRQGVDVYKDASSVVFIRNQKDIITAVMAREVDVGMVRTGLLEQQIARGVIDAKDIQVINQKVSPDFPYLHSTDLYPEWALAKTPQVSHLLARKVAVVLLAMPLNHEASLAGRYQGWTIPLDYLPVHDLMRRYKFGSYQNEGTFNFEDVLFRYRYWIALLALTLVSLAFFATKFYAFSRALSLETAEKENALEGKNEALLEKDHAIEQLRSIASHDAVTGLPNRYLLREHMEKDLRRGVRYGLCTAVCFIDLDGFKRVNDELGHDVGDRILQEAAGVIRQNVRRVDIAARYGGDEFLVLLYNVGEAKNAAMIATKLIDRISEIVLPGNKGLKMSASIGIVVSNGLYVPPDKLIQEADELMYEAKSDGPGQYRLEEKGETSDLDAA